MNLIINGKACEFGNNIVTIGNLIDELQIDTRGAAVECNLEIVPKSSYNNQQLNDGDKLEIVEFIGGG
jgi:thiamine biosynthesis protein ThiS